MDPTANLEEQLRLANGILSEDEDDLVADGDRLAKLVVALNEWIKKGGFLPKPWDDAQDRLVVIPAAAAKVTETHDDGFTTEYRIK